jgi:hypothetical protein
MPNSSTTFMYGGDQNYVVPRGTNPALQARRSVRGEPLEAGAVRQLREWHAKTNVRFRLMQPGPIEATPAYLHMGDFSRFTADVTYAWIGPREALRRVRALHPHLADLSIVPVPPAPRGEILHSRRIR